MIKMTIILLILTNHLFFLFSYLGKICDSKELKLKIKLFKTNQMVLQIKIFFVHLHGKIYQLFEKIKVSIR